MQRTLCQMLTSQPSWPVLLGWFTVGILGVNYSYSKHPSDGWDLESQLSHPALAPLRKAIISLALSDVNRESLLREVRAVIDRYGWSESAADHLPYLSSLATNSLSKYYPRPADCQSAPENVVLPFVAASDQPLISSPYRWGEPLRLQKKSSRGVEYTLTANDITLLLAHLFLSYDIRAFLPGENVKGDWEPLTQIGQASQEGIVAYRRMCE